MQVDWQLFEYSAAATENFAKVYWCVRSWKQWTQWIDILDAWEAGTCW